MDKVEIRVQLCETVFGHSNVLNQMQASASKHAHKGDTNILTFGRYNVTLP